MAFFRDNMGIIVKYKLAKILIAAVFATYLIVAGWLCTRIKGGLDYTSVFPHGTYGSRFAKLFYLYFTDYPQRLQIIVNATMDYSQPEVQAKINNLIQRFENTTYSGDETLTESWLKYFDIFSKDLRIMIILAYHDLRKKSHFLHALTNYFLPFETAIGFRSDIHLNKNATDITHTRFLVQLTKLHDSQTEMNMVEHVRNIADSFDFPVFVHDIWFTIYDIFLGIKSTFIQLFCTSLAATVVLFFVFAPSIPCAFCVLLCFSSINLGAVAYASLWNVNFNVISAFSQIGCTVVPALYIIQLPYAYHRSEGKQRIQQAFFFAGMPVFQNALMATVGLFILSFSPVPVFETFFKVAFIMISLSVLHAYFVIPTFLSFYESLYPQATVRRKSSLHRTSIKSSLRRSSIKSSLRRSSIVSSFKASIKTNREPDEDTKPMSVSDDNDIDSDVESGLSHSFSELSNNIFEFEDADLSDTS